MWAWRRPIYKSSYCPQLSTYLGFGTIYLAQVSVRQGSHPLPPWQVKHFANRILLLTRFGLQSFNQAAAFAQVLGAQFDDMPGRRLAA